MAGTEREDKEREERGGGESREDKLAQALRANLRRRKAALSQKPAAKPKDGAG